MKPFPNRTSTFQRIRLSPGFVSVRATLTTLSGGAAYTSSLGGQPRRCGVITPRRPFPHAHGLLPARVLRPVRGVTPALTTTTLLPRRWHWSSADLPRRELAPVPASRAQQFTRRLRWSSAPLTWRTTLGTRLYDCRDHTAPVTDDSQRKERVAGQGMTDQTDPARPHASLATVGVLMIVGVLDFDISCLTLSASATCSSWRCSSASSLACFPHELVLMPAPGGNPRRFGGVKDRTACQPRPGSPGIAVRLSAAHFRSHPFLSPFFFSNSTSCSPA
jgi:hypothetical protein